MDKNRKVTFLTRLRHNALRIGRNFFFPEFNSRTLLRMSCVAVAAVVIFGFVLRPCFVNGESMLPTYGKSGLVFCNLLRYRFAPPRRSDVVVISYFGRKYLLKRVIAFAGETVEFRKGRVFVDGAELVEEYVHFRGKWDFGPLTVAPGNCFVVGDNRAQAVDGHLFGEVSMERIAGGVLF